MKRILCLAVTTLAIGLMTTASHAQSNLNLRCKVPFPFTVENKTFLAGEYDVTQPAPGHLLLRNRQTQSAAIEAAAPARHPREADGRSRLLFNRYGNKYFLVGVSAGSIESTYDLLKSKEEKRLADVTSRPRPNLVSLLSNGTIQTIDDGQ